MTKPILPYIFIIMYAILYNKFVVICSQPIKESSTINTMSQSSDKSTSESLKDMTIEPKYKLIKTSIDGILGMSKEEILKKNMIDKFKDLNLIEIKYYEAILDCMLSRKAYDLIKKFNANIEILQKSIIPAYKSTMDQCYMVCGNFYNIENIKNEYDKTFSFKILQILYKTNFIKPTAKILHQKYAENKLKICENINTLKNKAEASKLEYYKILDLLTSYNNYEMYCIELDEKYELCEYGYKKLIDILLKKGNELHKFPTRFACDIEAAENKNSGNKLALKQSLDKLSDIHAIISTIDCPTRDLKSNINRYLSDDIQKLYAAKLSADKALAQAIKKDEELFDN